MKLAPQVDDKKGARLTLHLTKKVAHPNSYRKNLSNFSNQLHVSNISR
jgi:hypothetical protein